ncbi:MAG: cytochrome ubiquinol oxidase subunit I [Cellvibrionaceae bacterium]|nr:cytochrome ubiquinol oxidase subunit I [Cellvibrionaceae bacterium]
MDIAVDTAILSRVQFALNISFHILFPTITIALCWLLLFFKIRWHQTTDPVWMRCYRFWVKVFALSFALGVVSGITMSFQFGTNWPGFMSKAGNIAGPLLGYEVLTAFFLEATFLGVMLFGIERVSPRLHTIATTIVALGTTASAFWILALNSWMQTPVGHELRDGVFYPLDWWAIIFNPSFGYRFVHMLLASLITASFLLIGISAYRLLKGDPKPAPRISLRIGAVIAAVALPVQIVVGDLHGLNTLEHQPAKVAAMEGIWETQRGAELLLFALPDESSRSNHYSIGLPKMASWILTHDSNGEIKGLNDFIGEHPPVAAVFWSFRVMVGCGLLMLALAWILSWRLWRRRRLGPWLLKACVAMTFSGWLATLAGWYVSEIGRQPFLIQGLLRTEATATTIGQQNLWLSLGLYSLLYGGLLWAYIHTLFLMARKSAQLEMPSSAVAQGA